VLGGDPKKHSWGKRNIKQEREEASSGDVDEQVTTVGEVNKPQSVSSER